MSEKTHTRTDLYLLLSLLLVILLHPVLNRHLERRFLLGLLMFVPVILATIRLSHTKGWLWPTCLLMLGVFIFGVGRSLTPNPVIVGVEFVMLTGFYGLCVVGLFPYLKNARSVLSAHLYTAASIYLLLGLAWFSLYSAIEVFYPGAILRSSAAIMDRPSELLYFSLVNLTTIGY